MSWLLVLSLLTVEMPPATSPDVLVDEPTTAPADTSRAPDLELPGGIVVELLTREEAKAAIVDASDPFFAKVSPLEVSFRLDRDVTALPREKMLAEYREFLQGEVTDWPARDRQYMVEMLPRVYGAVAMACPKILPKRWRFIRSTGNEESNAPYTRGDCIVIPAQLVQGFANQPVESFGRLMVHETFHVHSRQNPKQRDELYRLIGFEPIAPVALPAAVDRIRLTNPDGPGWEHAIEVIDKESGEKARAILLLTSRIPEFQAGIGGVLPVLQFHLYPLTDGETPGLRLGDGGEPVRWTPFITPGFLETIGRNTGYMIHPDEILADNVALLAYPRIDPPTPELLEKLRALVGPDSTAPPEKSPPEKSPQENEPVKKAQ